MSVSEIYAAEFAAQRDEMPTTFTFNSVNYTGSLTDLKLEQEMRDEGYLSGADAELTIALGDFTTAPTVLDYVTIGGTEYRVEERTDSLDGVIAKLTLKKFAK